jgi:hypothetical protein
LFNGLQNVLLFEASGNPCGVLGIGFIIEEEPAGGNSGNIQQYRYVVTKTGKPP